MKKSLIALAALATVATAAQAQSSVSVYGILDANIQSIKTDGTGAQAQQGENALSVSRLGFRGTEDLGGGLKAEFQLESRLSVANGYAGSSSAAPLDGSQTSTYFNRESWVGLSSASLGSIRMGFTDVSDAVNIDAAVSQFGELVLGSELGTDKARVIRYTTPVFSGFSAQYGFASPNSTSAGVEATNGNIDSAVVKYEQGKLGLYAATETLKVTTSGANYNRRQSTFGAKYDFGFVALGAWYGAQDQDTTSTYAKGDKKMTRLTLSAPVEFLGSGVRFHAGYLKDKTDVAQTSDNTDYRLGLTKALSKRTTLYAAHISTNYVNNTSTVTADVKKTLVGFRHAF